MYNGMEQARSVGWTGTSTSAPGGGVGVDRRFGWRCKFRGRQDGEAERGYGDGHEESRNPEGQDWAFALVLHAVDLELRDDEVTLQMI
jgi:hypothetical protein